MECKFCGAPLEEEAKICAVCGKDQTEEIEETTAEESAEQAELTEKGSEESAEILEEPEEELPPRKNTGKMVLWGIVIALVAAVVAVTAFLASGVSKENEDLTVTGGRSFTMPVQFMNEDIAARVVADTEKAGILAEAKELLGKEIGEDGLTNAELAIYYWDTFYAFYEAYWQYLSSLDLDPATMDKTVCPLSQEQTWQEYFLSQALNRYRSQTALCRAAEEVGFAYTEQQRKEHDDTVAALSAHEERDTILYNTYGPGVTMEDYLDYWSMQYYYSCYINSLMEVVEYTDEDLSAFYDEHAQDYAGIYLQKVDKPVMDVRHILIAPAETGTEEDWAAAEKKAQEVYDQFLAGDKTEEAFGELAKVYSVDGSASVGGLYEDVYPGQMVTAFNDWCFDDSRKPGDHGIVKTEFGYHIMYYVAQGETIHWKTIVSADYIGEAVNAQVQAEARAYVLSWDPDQVALSLPGQVQPAEAE